MDGGGTEGAVGAGGFRRTGAVETTVVETTVVVAFVVADGAGGAGKTTSGGLMLGAARIGWAGTATIFGRAVGAGDGAAVTTVLGAFARVVAIGRTATGAAGLIGIITVGAKVWGFTVGLAGVGTVMIRFV